MSQSSCAKLYYRRRAALPAEHEQVLEGEVGAIDHVESRPSRLGLGNAGFDSTLRLRSRPAASWLVVDDADAAVRLQRERQIAKERHAIWFIDFLVGVDDQYRVERTHGQVEVRIGAQPRFDVSQPLTADAPFDRLEHRLLDVLRVDAALSLVHGHASRETDGEKATAGADVGDLVAFRDPERIHDQLGLLPCRAIRHFEQSEVRRIEEATLPSIGRRLRRKAGLCDQNRSGDDDGEATRSAAASLDRHHALSPSPAIPGRVITSAESTRSSWLASISPRSKTSSRIGRPVFTDSFATSAVFA